MALNLVCNTFVTYILTIVKLFLQDRNLSYLDSSSINAKIKCGKLKKTQNGNVMKLILLAKSLTHAKTSSVVIYEENFVFFCL